MEVRQEIINERGKYLSVVNESEIPDTKNTETTGEKDAEKKENQSLIENNIKIIRAKLQEAGITTEQEIEILNSGISTNN